MENRTLSIPDTLAGERFDKALATLVPDLSRSRLQGLIEQGVVTVDGAVLANGKLKASAGATVSIVIPPAIDAAPQAQDIALDIVYEDQDLLVLNKPAGLVVHPAAGHADGTLVNALIHHCGDSLSGINGVRRPGIVHRLDKDTSGLMMVAKNDFAHNALAAQLADRSLSRRYKALVWGVPMPPIGTIDTLIGRAPKDRLKMAVLKGGEARQAVTHYTIEQRYGDVLALVECRLATGRTHQIRVHMQHIKCPIVGDPLYGLPATARNARLKKSTIGEDGQTALSAFARQALHAGALQFIHPRKDKPMEFSAPIPPDMENLLNLII